MQDQEGVAVARARGISLRPTPIFEKLRMAQSSSSALNAIDPFFWPSMRLSGRGSLPLFESSHTLFLLMPKSRATS